MEISSSQKTKFKQYKRAYILIKYNTLAQNNGSNKRRI